MFDAPLDLQNARILLTNDDGIEAPGLQLLERIARSLSDDIWVVAPATEQSGVSHSLSLHAPLRIHQRSDRRFSVDGSPTDCVLLAIGQLMQDRRPDLLLSGVNRGANLGDDVTYSGTIAAALEATILGVPAIALSQVQTYDHPVKWSTCEHFAAAIIRKMTRDSWPDGTYMNVNFPDLVANSVRGIEVVRLGRRKFGYELVQRLDPRGRPYVWIGRARNDPGDEVDTDLARSAEGVVTITPLHLDLTHSAMLDTLQKTFE